VRCGTFSGLDAVGAGVAMALLLVDVTPSVSVGAMPVVVNSRVVRPLVRVL
jgi:hypothetical protein